MKGRKLAMFFMVSLILLLAAGCSVYMASTQPEKKNVELLTVGTPRSAVLAEFGNPLSSEVVGGEKCDVYKFRQGYSKGAKTGRAVFHGVADVLTLGLWEVIGTPTEAVYSGEDMCFEIRYDQNDRIIQVKEIKKEAKEDIKKE